MFDGDSCTVTSLYMPLTVRYVQSQVLSAPSQRAVAGLERTNTTPAPGAIEWLTPIRPLPSGPVGAGVTDSVSVCSPRFIPSSVGCPARLLIASAKSSHEPTGLPSSETTRSPALSPAFAAGPPDTTSPILA